MVRCPSRVDVHRIFRRAAVTLGMLALSVIAGCSRTESDLLVELHVRLATDAVLRAYDIEAAIVDGKVALRGFTRTQGDQEHAVALARAIVAPRDVVNELRILDEALQQDVTNRLKADPLVGPRRISVEVYRGRVRLSSDDTNADERARAVAIVGQIYGVLGVDDHMH